MFSKRQISKYFFICLTIFLFLAIPINKFNNVYAVTANSVTENWDWEFSINRVIDPISGEDIRKVYESGKSYGYYVLSSDSVIIETNYVATCYPPGMYPWLNGRPVGNNKEKCTRGKSSLNGYNHYLQYTFDNLPAGINKIKVIADRPRGLNLTAYTGGLDKVDEITVVVPGDALSGRIKEAIDNINSGNAVIEDYKSLDLENIDISLLSDINKTIIKAKQEKGIDLTKEEISKIVTELPKNISDSAIRINEGNGSVSDYNVLNIDIVTKSNLSDVNWYLKGKGTDKSKITNRVNEIIDLLRNINTRHALVGAYQEIGITTVNTSNLENINNAVILARNKKGADLTREEIEQVVMEYPQQVVVLLKKINEGNGSVSDYNLFVTIVTDKNVEDVNWYLKGKNVTEATVKTNINTIVNALNYLNNGYTSLSDYKTAGITGVTSYNVSNIANSIKLSKNEKGSNLTRAEIQKIATAEVEARAASLKKINEGNGSVSDYNLFVTTVTDKNIEDVNWYLKGKNVTEATVKTNINTIVNALNYLNNGYTSLSDYKTAGITGVTSYNVSNIANSIKLSKNEKGSNLTRAEIQKIATAEVEARAASLKKINEGNGSVSDYNLFVTTVTDKNVEDVNWYLKGKNVTEATVKTNINTIVNALNSLNNGNTSVSYYTTAGITGVTSYNVSNIANSIKLSKNEKGSNLTRAEIQKIATAEVEARAASLKKINEGNGSVSDYNLFVTTVTDKNVEDVNWYLKGKNVTEATVKTNINTIVNALNSLNNGNTSVSYYTTAGITGVTSYNVSNIANSIKLSKNEKGSNLTRAEIQKIVNNI